MIVERAVVILGVLFFGYFLGIPLTLFMAEQNKYMAAMKKISRMDILTFISLVEEIKNRRLRALLIRSVFDKGYLTVSAENVSKLRILIAFIQTSLASEYTAQNFKGLVEINKEMASALGYVDESNYPLTNHWSEEHLDLLCRMLEQMQKATSS